MSEPIIDRDACKGHGRCYMTAPTVFDTDDDGFGIVIGAPSSSAEEAEMDRAINNCPERAITVAAAATD